MWMWELPAELSLKILPLLSLKDIEQCRLACKQWRFHLDSVVKEPLSWLTSPSELHEVNLHSHNALTMEREEGLYAMHPIINVGNDFFIFERKANERFASALHVVHKRDYEGSVKLTKQTIWLAPFNVLSVDQVFVAYSTPGSNHWLELRGGCFSTVEIFERKTFRSLPWHVALTNVLTMCQKDNIIYHVCLFEDDNSTSGKCFKLFGMKHLQWQELASIEVNTFIRRTLEEYHTSLCALNIIKCKPHMQVEGSLVMWICSTHSNRLFLANVDYGTVTVMELYEASYMEIWKIPFNCPIVLFGGNVLGIRVRSRLRWLRWEFVQMDLINISTNQLLEECPENRNLQQICSDKFLVYMMEVHKGNEFLLLCIAKNGYKIRKANFQYYSHGFYNDIRMAFSKCQEQLFIHMISNEIYTSLRCSNHLLVFDLTQEDLNLGMRVFNLGLSHYPPAISFTSGLIMQDVGFIRMNENTQWFGAIKISSINASGFAYMTQKHKGTQECGPLSVPVYLSNCKKDVWSRQSSSASGHHCTWCGVGEVFHHSLGRDIPLRMESGILLVDNEALREVQDPYERSFCETRTGIWRMKFLQKKRMCRGFIPKPKPELFHIHKYFPCKGDETSCFHARWKDA